MLSNCWHSWRLLLSQAVNSTVRRFAWALCMQLSNIANVTLSSKFGKAAEYCISKQYVCLMVLSLHAYACCCSCSRCSVSCMVNCIVCSVCTPYLMHRVFATVDFTWPYVLSISMSWCNMVQAIAATDAYDALVTSEFMDLNSACGLTPCMSADVCEFGLVWLFSHAASMHCQKLYSLQTLVYEARNWLLLSCPWAMSLDTNIIQTGPASFVKSCWLYSCIAKHGFKLTSELSCKQVGS